MSHYPPPAGGIASWTKRLLEKGLPDGWDISHININTINGRDPFKNTKKHIKDEYIRTRNIWKQEVERLKSEKDISVVHTCIPCTVFGMMRETVSGMIAKRYKKKFILHCRCTVPNVVNNSFKLWWFRRLAGYCDGIMVLNEKSYDFAKKYSNALVELIPNFVTAEELTGAERGEYREAANDFIYVGGVTPDKGCDTIIDSAKAFPDITFHLVGSVSAETEALPHTDNVKFYGNREKPELKEMLSKADVFLFLSRYWGEGFSNALVEAMSAGLPCIVSDWAANADMIGEDGGIVLEENDSEHLKAAVEKLYRDKVGRQAMGERNIRVAKERYSDDVVLRQYTEFYEKVLNIQ